MLLLEILVWLGRMDSMEIAEQTCGGLSHSRVFFLLSFLVHVHCILDVFSSLEFREKRGGVRSVK